MCFFISRIAPPVSSSGIARDIIVH
jgi:hypothetical protein